MYLALLWVGSVFYLLQKVFFSLAERAHAREDQGLTRRYRIASWVSCIIGLPAWVILFVGWRNWIVAAVEASVGPAVVMGLLMSAKGRDWKSPRWLDWLAKLCIAAGFAWSFYDLGILTQITQWLETGLVVGFGCGTYLIARERQIAGYRWLVFMHLSCGTLFWVQDSPWLARQQAASIIFVLDALIVRTRLERRKHSAAVRAPT